MQFQTSLRTFLTAPSSLFLRVKSCLSPLARPFSSNPQNLSKGQQLPPRPTVSESELSESFLKGTGPGGQKINKTSSAVQLTHLPTGVVVKSQATRSRSQNRKIARRLLAEKLEVAEKGAKSRVEVKREVSRRRKASGAKKRRRKYRALAGEGGKESGGDMEDGEENWEDEGQGKQAGGAKDEMGDRQGGVKRG